MEVQKKSEEISLKETILQLIRWWKYLLSKWLVIICFGILGGMAGLAYAYSKNTQYVAELSFIVEGGKQGSGLGGYSSLASQFGINLGGASGGGIFEGENLVALLKSRSMIEKSLLKTVNVKGKAKTFAEFYIDIYKLREKWIKEGSKLKVIHFLPGDNPQVFSSEQRGFIKSLHKTIVAANLVVDKQDKKSSIMIVRVTSEDELFSKAFAETLMKEVSDFYVQSKIKKSKLNLSLLQHQADSVRKEFNDAVTSVASSIDINPNPNPARQTLKVPSQIKGVDAQANQAMLVELMKNLAVSQISLREETPLIQIIDQPSLPLDEINSNKINLFILGSIFFSFLAAGFLIVLKVFKDIQV